MGSVRPDLIQRVPGQLILNPTDLTGSTPFGGTLLGSVRDMAFRIGNQAQFIIAEEWGGAVEEVILGKDEAKFACVFRSWDEDVLAAVIPHSSAGSVTGLRLIVNQPGKDDSSTTRPGRALSPSFGAKLCFAPRAADRHPFIVLYNAVPAVEASFELSLSIGLEFALGVVWHGAVDASARVYAIGRREDITL